MSDDAPSIQTFAVMFEGFSAAVERFQQASSTAGANATYAPVFESLNWAVALYDRVRQHWAPEGAVPKEAASSSASTVKVGEVSGLR